MGSEQVLHSQVIEAPRSRRLLVQVVLERTSIARQRHAGDGTRQGAIGLMSWK
jgi:hypothetical protein